ncbi:MAG: hypothetical protein HRU09_02150 [Oligoflexales bacterium]|nr:hypothetical protein [Oligoflexales bacterium]
MFKFLTMILAIIVVSACRFEQEELESWEEPLFELECRPQRVTLPFDEKLSRTQPFKKFEPGRQKKTLKEYWNYKPKDESRSKVWQKAFKRRLDAYSKRWVRYPFLPLRVSPSMKAKVTGQLLQGDLVWVQSISDNWARLKSGVYVPIESLSPFPPGLGGIGDGFLMEEPLN